MENPPVIPIDVVTPQPVDHQPEVAIVVTDDFANTRTPAMGKPVPSSLLMSSNLVDQSANLNLNADVAMTAQILNDPVKLLAELVRARIVQKAQYFETFCPCELENEYTIYAGNPHDPDVEVEKINKVFTCKERSTCFQRTCCASFSREFAMDIRYKGMEYNELTSQYGCTWLPFVALKREYKCTCCCINRPVLTVELNYNGIKEQLGYIVSEFNCCVFSFAIHEGKEEKASYKLSGDCCQCGICCNCPCEKCMRAVFDMYDCKSYGKKIGEVKKVWSTCAKECCSDANEYIITFPGAATWQQKVLFLSAMLFMDYCYFEKKGKQN